MSDVELPEKAPTIWPMIWQLIYFSIAFDAIYFAFHLLMHKNRFLYRWLVFKKLKIIVFLF